MRTTVASDLNVLFFQKHFVKEKSRVDADTKISMTRFPNDL